MIIKRGKVWHYKFQIDGKLYRGSTKQTGKQKAEEFEKVLYGRIKDGERVVKVKDKSPSLSDYLGKFSMYVEKHNSIAVSTKDYYQAGIEYLMKQPIADMRLHMIQKEDINTIQFPKDYSGSTINRSLRTLRRALNMAVENDIINKCPKIKLAKEHQRKQTISNDMEQTVMEEITPSGKLAMTIMLDCGLRPAEIVALRIEHLDFERMTILVVKGKTHKSSRFVPMSDRVRDVIVEHLKGRTEGWLLPSNRKPGQPLQRRTLTQAFGEVRRAGNLPQGTVLYLARHTYATDIMQETGNIFVTKEIMGHSSTATLGRYQHSALAGMADAINARNARNAEKVTIKSQLRNAPKAIHTND